MLSPAAPAIRRQFQPIPPLNSSSADYYNESSIRICCPIYIDLSTVQRKELLNGVRSAMSPKTSTNTVTGISVVTSVENDVEGYLGLTFDNLRNVIFQRGGLPIDLVLKLQSVTGIEMVTLKDLQDCFKHRITHIKEWTKNHSYKA